MNRIDVSKLDIDQLKTLIRRHEAHGATNELNYIDALRELSQCDAPELNFRSSLELLLRAARERRFLSYGDLADASGVPWDRVRYKMNKHLWAIVCFAANQGWPMLSAIVVNKQHVATGNMERSSLNGFIGAAKLLGHRDITDENGFLREQQKQCFEKAAPGSLSWVQ